MKYLFLAIILFVSTQAFANNSSTGIHPLDIKPGETVGNIKTGKKIELSWAELSSVAAFPGTRFEMFNGNHVLYRTSLPAGSKIVITLTPEAGKLINLYALRQGINETAVPPAITSAISAEASYPIYANTGDGRRISNPDDGTRKIEFISVGNPYGILIGVAGAENLAEGGYKLQVQVIER